jgi:hypothetical protein
MLDKRKKKKLCGRCGYSNHIRKTCESPEPWTDHVERSLGDRKKLAVAAAIKRKRQSNDVELKPEAKKPKAATLAIQAISVPIWPFSNDEEQQINDAQMTDF